MSYKTKNGYFYEIQKGGKKKRISKEKFNKNLTNLKPNVGDYVNIIVKPYAKKIYMSGIVTKLLTKKNYHSRGHKVVLEDGSIGRVINTETLKNIEIIRPSNDPRVFGPCAWKTFHIFAYNYPHNPSKNTKDACVNFIKGIPYMLPCGYCGYYFKEYTAKHDLSIVTKNQKNVVKFFKEAHNNITKNVNPSKKITSHDYSTGVDKSGNNLWKGKELKR